MVLTSFFTVSLRQSRSRGSRSNAMSSGYFEPPTAARPGGIPAYAGTPALPTGCNGHEVTAPGGKSAAQGVRRRRVAAPRPSPAKAKPTTTPMSAHTSAVEVEVTRWVIASTA